MISAKSSKSGKNTDKFIESLIRADIFKTLNKYGQMGVNALSNATPVDSGLAASSWGYVTKNTRGRYSLIWYNDNVENGVQVAVIIQYGHATKNGGWVEGIDYVNPAIQPIMDKCIDEVWEKVRHG
jgi:hypothetical protein